MTQQLSVNDSATAIAFMVEKFGQQTSPEQLVRELVHNAIQACKNRLAVEPEMAGKLRVEIDEDAHERQTRGVSCLRIADNGIGMTSVQFGSMMNQLFSSGQKQSTLDNFGIGAKIAGLYHSPMGLRYASWTDKEAMMATLWKDPNGTYGLKEDYETVIDEDRPWLQIPSGAICDESMCIFRVAHLHSGLYRFHSKNEKPKGTCVTVLGKHASHNTFLSLTADENKTSGWLRVYLSQRYYRSPGVSIYLKDYQSGQQGILFAEEANRRTCSSHGSVQLNGAMVHWSISSQDAHGVKSQGHNSSTSQYYITKSRFAFVFQNECVMMSASRYGAQIKKYGIHAGFNQVRLFVEVMLPDVEWDASRTMLVRKDGKELPEEQWQSEFAAKMPQEIKNLMDSEFAKMQTQNTENLRKLLQNLPWAYTPRYRASKDGLEQVDDSLAGVKANPGDSSEDAAAGENPKKPPMTDPKENGLNARNIGSAVDLPRVVWTDPSEDHSDLNGNNIGYYLSGSGSAATLYLNNKHPTFLAARHSLCDEFVRLSPEVVDGQLKDLISACLMCVIIGSRKERQAKIPSSEVNQLTKARGLTSAFYGSMWNIMTEATNALRKMVTR
jgi:hypothetical protein